MKWYKIKLGEVAEIFSGYAFKASNLANSGIPVIKIANIQNNKVLKESNTYWPEELLSTKMNKYYLQKDDFLIAMTGAGSVGKVGKMKGMDKKYLVNQRVGIVRVNIKKANPEFIYQLLSQDIYEDYMYGLGLGAGQPNISPSNISGIEISIPDLMTQTKIASILSAYDDLIENNTRRIKILEEIAQTIYKEWFVNFRFPGHEKVKFVDSPLGKIPEGWGVKLIEDLADPVGGGTPSTKEINYWSNGTILWFTPSDLTKNNSFILLDSDKKITELGLKKSSARLLPPNTILMTSRATIGFFGIIDKEVCTNQGFINIIPLKENLRYYLLFNLMNRKEEIINNANGATYKEIIKSRFRRMDILKPSDEILDNFEKVISPFVYQIRILKYKNEKLHLSRDLLLPKLMSGKIEV